MALSMNRNQALQKTAIDRAAKGARGPKRERGEKTKKVSAGQGRFVLFVGDEGAILTYTSKFRVARRMFAASPAPEHTEQMRALLDSDNKAPVYMLLDSMDQSYQRQTLPPVAKVSLGKIIQRRLERDFAADDIKGALEIGREKSGRKDWNYLLVAVATNGAVNEWMNLLIDRPNPFRGLYLSPVESEGLIVGLADAIGERAEIVIEAPSADAKGKKAKAPKAKKKGGAAFPWQLLISHHKVGGFRLVVVNEGRLVFTRLAQPVGDASPAVVAGNVEQEAVNTIEYMKRMGYHEGEELQVLILASGDIKDSLDVRNIPATRHHFFTPAEAAAALKLNDVAQPEDHYADILLSVFLLTMKKHRLVLHSPQTKKIAGLAAAAKGVRGLAALIALGLVCYGFYEAWIGISFGEELERLEREQKTQNAAMEQMQQTMKQFPGDVKQMLDVLRLYRQYGKDTKYFPSTAMAGIATLPRDAFGMIEAKWARSLKAPQYGSGPSAETLDFTVDGEVFKTPNDTLPSLKVRLDKILKQAAASFPDSKVEYGNLPQIFNETSELKTTIGGSAADDAFQKMMSEMLKVQLHITAPKPDTPPGAGR